MHILTYTDIVKINARVLRKKLVEYFEMNELLCNQ